MSKRSPIPVKLLTAVPGRGSAPLLARIYRQQFKAYAISQLRLFGKHTDLNIRSARETVERLDPSRKWSPPVFLAGYDLGNAVRSLDVTGCYDALAAFENLTPEAIYDTEPTVSSLLSESWEPPFVRHMREFTSDSAKTDTLVLPMMRDELENHRAPIAKALRFIKKFDPEVWAEFENYVTRIKVFSGEILNGETANVVFGSIWLQPPGEGQDPVAYWIEHLVHEISHLQLFVLSVNDRLVLNAPTELFPAPLRADPRPMFGNFHATFVLARMVRIFRRLAQTQRAPAYAACLEEFSDSFKAGLAGVYSERARLTPVGLRIRESLADCAFAS